MTEYEYSEQVDNLGVKRASTDRWYLLQSSKEKAVKIINAEIAGLDFAGLYLLVNSAKNLIYVGESSEVKKRIQSHIKKPPKEIRKFDMIIIIWDGRPITTSRFGEETLRKSLEKELIKVCDPKFSQYTFVNKITNPKQTSIYKNISSNILKDELYFLLYKCNLIHTMP